MFSRIIFFTVISGIIIILFFKLLGENGLQAYFLLVQEAEEAQSIIESVNQKEVALSKEIRLLRSNKDYIREQVKIRLHYLYPNEILYTFTKVDSP